MLPTTAAEEPNNPPPDEVSSVRDSLRGLSTSSKYDYMTVGSLLRVNRRKPSMGIDGDERIISEMERLDNHACGRL